MYELTRNATAIRRQQLIREARTWKGQVARALKERRANERARREDMDRRRMEGALAACSLCGEVRPIHYVFTDGEPLCTRCSRELHD